MAKSKKRKERKELHGKELIEQLDKAINMLDEEHGKLPALAQYTPRYKRIYGTRKI